MPRTILSDAREVASRAHAGALYGTAPYTEHLDAVEAALERFRWGDDEALRAAAWLHDAVEDTSVSLEDIKRRFGDDVAGLVDAVTDCSGRTRRDRKPRTLAKTARSGERAVALKLADRIANVERGGSKLGMYRREQPEFRAALRGVGEDPRLEPMWQHLEDALGTAAEASAGAEAQPSAPSESPSGTSSSRSSASPTSSVR
jgi:hypothetical protein